MPNHPSSLSYASPPKKRPCNIFLAYGPFLFYLTAILASAIVNAFNVFILENQKNIFAPTFELFFLTLFAAAWFSIPYVFIAISLLLIESWKPNLEPRTSRIFWLTTGSLTGFLTTLPPTLDALTFTHIRTEGILETQGWGDTLRIILFCLTPLLTLLLSLRRNNSVIPPNQIPTTPSQK